MENDGLLLYWNDIPIGRENARSYEELSTLWSCCERTVRRILQALSYYDNGDDLILIRSSKTNGFYRTDDILEIEEFRKECLKKGKSIFAPIRKINRVLKNDPNQIDITGWW